MRAHKLRLGMGVPDVGPAIVGFALVCVVLAIAGWELVQFVSKHLILGWR